jgi:hypothetical protein
LGKRLLALFLLSGAGQGALKDIGKQAVAAQPDNITLSRISNPAWQDAGVQPIISSLRSAGFDDAGVYSVDKMPGVKVALLVKPEDCVAAHVYDRPGSGLNWSPATRMVPAPPSPRCPPPDKASRPGLP